MKSKIVLFVGDTLGSYGFPDGHPFSIDRQGAFWAEATKKGLDRRVAVVVPRLASRAELLVFHEEKHVAWVEERSRLGTGYLDYGDTPAFPGVLEAASAVTGTALEGLDRLMSGETLRTFQPIGGMHHARRDRAAGFCVFNDLGAVIDAARARFGIRRIAYVDIDVHHGDGVFYSYEADPDLIFADIHEDGRFLYPGTGFAEEAGSGEAAGMKLNIPLAPGDGDREFYGAWERVLSHLRRYRPELVIFQAGADSLAGDPLAHLRFSPAAHAHATKTLIALAEETAKGRLMVFGGGGYDLRNLAAAWTGVLAELIKAG
jgi:acetoin utilization protein AcuC